jgi:hypothetical protein
MNKVLSGKTGELVVYGAVAKGVRHVGGHAGKIIRPAVVLAAMLHFSAESIRQAVQWRPQSADLGQRTFENNNLQVKYGDVHF